MLGAPRDQATSGHRKQRRHHHGRWSTSTGIVAALAALLPDRELNKWFRTIIAQGTGKRFTTAPDPEHQPILLTDEASLVDAVAVDAEEISRRLSVYFPQPLEIDVRLPIWQLVDAIRRQRPGWPDDEPS